MIPQIFKITKKKKENNDTFSIHLQRDAGLESSKCIPGQFNMLYAWGVGESAISISRSSAGKQEYVHTIRTMGSVTKAIERLSVGASIGVRGPFGSGWPLPEAEGKDVILVAGGIGLAPLRPVLDQIAEERKKYGNVTLLYGARSPKDLIFQNDLREFMERSQIQVEVTVDHGEVNWKGRIGVVPALISRAQFDPQATIAMVCGPEVMMRFSAIELEKAGVSDDSIYLSMERNMKCGTGFCGHCQFMPHFVCKDGPVFSLQKIRPFFGRKEI